MTSSHNRLILALGAALVGCLTLAGRRGPAPASAAGRDGQAAPDPPAVILRIVGRESTIVARARQAGQGPTYVLYSNAGELLIPDMTLPQLQAKHPELADQILHLHADQHAAPVHWAGIEID